MFIGRSISTTLLPCFHTCLCLWLSVSMNETSGFPTTSALLTSSQLTTPESGDHRLFQSFFRGIVSHDQRYKSDEIGLMAQQIICFRRAEMVRFAATRE